MHHTVVGLGLVLEILVKVEGVPRDMQVQEVLEGLIRIFTVELAMVRLEMVVVEVVVEVAPLI
jgi:hypothetical protein